MPEANSPKYPEAQAVPKAEAKPSTKSDLVARQVTNHVLGCRCPRCMEVRTGFDIGFASGMSGGVAAGRAQAAADIQEYGERLRSSSWNPHTGVALGAIADEAARIAEGADGGAEPATGGVVRQGPVVRLGECGCSFPSAEIPSRSEDA